MRKTSEQDVIQKEVKIGLQHVEKSQALGQEIHQLVSLKSMSEKRLVLQRSKYQKMKAYFPF